MFCLHIDHLFLLVMFILLLYILLPPRPQSLQAGRWRSQPSTVYYRIEYHYSVLLGGLCPPKAVSIIVNASILFHIFLWKFVCSPAFQRFHRSNIDLNYSRKEEDWYRSLLSKSDGSGHLLRIYKSLRAIFTRCLRDILLTNKKCIICIIS